MSIGTVTVDGVAGEKPSAPMFAIDVEFAGDGAYPTGGTPAFTESVRDALEAKAEAAADKNVRGRSNVEIVCVAGYDAGKYVPFFDAANDKLFVRDGGSATWAEVANATDLSGVTFKLTLLCK